MGFASQGEEISTCLVLGNKRFSLPSEDMKRKTKLDTEGSVTECVTSKPVVPVVV